MGDARDAGSRGAGAPPPSCRAAGRRPPDAVVPKTSAGQGLRAVLGTFDRPPRVVSTHGELDSLDVILRRVGASRPAGAFAGRAGAPEAGASVLLRYAADDVVAAVSLGTDPGSSPPR